MAIWLNKGEQDGTQASCVCDSSADVVNLPTFAQKHHLKVGSTCLVIEGEGGAEIRKLNSEGEWKKI